MLNCDILNLVSSWHFQLMLCRQREQSPLPSCAYHNYKCDLGENQESRRIITCSLCTYKRILPGMRMKPPIIADCISKLLCDQFLCTNLMDYLCASIFNCMISILVSFLHLGQKRGKLTRIVSLLTLILVLPLQIG